MERTLPLPSLPIVSRVFTTQTGRAVCLFLLLVLVSFSRHPDFLRAPQFFAEDGNVFFTQQLTLGTMAALLKPYAGYLQVIPRLLAALACAAPILWTPFLFNFLAIVVGAISAAVFSLDWYRSLIHSDLLRIALPIVIYAGMDTSLLGNLTSLLWLVMPLSLLLLLIAPEIVNSIRPRYLYLLGLTNLLIALSQPLCIILVPFILWRLRTYRRLAWVLPGGLLVGLLAQFIAYLSQPVTQRATTGVLTWLIQISVAIADRILLCSLVGQHWTETMSCSMRTTLVLLFATAFVLLTAYIFRRSAKAIALISGGVYLVVASIAVPLRLRFGPEVFRSLCEHIDTEWPQYFFIGSIGILFLVAVFLENTLRREGARAGIFALLLFPALGSNSRPEMIVTENSHWGLFAKDVSNWLHARRSGGAVAETVVPITPSGWVIDLPPLRGAHGESMLDSVIVSDDLRTYYLADQGKKRVIPDEKTLVALNAGTPIRLAPAQLAQLPVGDALPPLKSNAVQDSETHRIAVIEKGRRHEALDFFTVMALGVQSSITNISDRDYLRVPLGPPVLRRPVISVSALQNSRGGIYLEAEGVRHPIPNIPTLIALNLEKQVRIVPDKALEGIPVGPTIPNIPTRAIARGTTGEIFYLEGGSRHRVPDMETLEALHLTTKTTIIPEAFTDIIPLGLPMPHINKNEKQP